MEQKEYNIGGRVFILKKLVMGQWKQLMPLIPAGRHDPLDIIGSPRVLAIILGEKGQKLQQKDLTILENFLEEEMDGITTLEVVADFFALNPMDLFLQRMEEVRRQISILAGRSTASSSSSPPETSLEEKKSSGDIVSPNASPT